MARPELPIPESQLHYADAANNPQSLPIDARIRELQYPTLGCPALLTPGRPLRIVLSLNAKPHRAKVELVARHRDGGRREVPCGAPEEAADFNHGRRAWIIAADVSAVREGFYDLEIAWDGGIDTQLNAVRVFSEIRGDEKVVFCGDSQYNVNNRICIDEFVERMNAVEAAWIAVIGDICDNGVKGHWNVVKLVLRHDKETVEHYYAQEYPQAYECLTKLNKPVFLVPGNHDGMVAYAKYAAGTMTSVFVGPDPANEVAYDGLHHYRRTFGPTYYSFDWGMTRYLCTNTFELNRHNRLGFHCIVANWGGWMQETQMAWLEEELADADAKGMHKVMLMHHDPRGGDKGKKLGQFHAYREYDHNSLNQILRSYVAYLVDHRLSLSQQEWMAHKHGGFIYHQARRILDMVRHYRVAAIFMGHDNKNWIDSYDVDENILVSNADPVSFDSTPAGTGVGTTVPVRISQEVAMAFEADDPAAIERAVDGLSEEKKDAAIVEGIRAYVEVQPFPFEFVGDVCDDWNLRAKAPIHFIHVDDIGAYKHQNKQDRRDYGYVLATLLEGRPNTVQGFRMDGERRHKPVQL